MSESDDAMGDVFSGRAARRERIVAQFEEAWERGEQPSVGDYLTGPEGQRQSILVELVHVDLERRLKVGQPARVEEYLAPYPDLARHDTTVVELIVAEYSLRRRGEEDLTAAEYLGRFPQLARELAERLAAEPAARAEAGASPQEPGQVTSSEFGETSDTAGAERLPSGQLHIRCPHCHNQIELLIDTPLTDITCSACGSSFSLVGRETPTRQSTPLERVGHFRLVSRLGVGAFGTVWKAHDTELDRVVAIKIPRAGHLDAKQADQFLREARAVAQLDHPNIVSVHEVGREGGVLYIVSDLVRGVSLSEWLTGQRPTHREAARLCGKLADALHHAHERGVVHRDLKPANIMLDGEAQPHIMDFGLAKRDAGEITMTVDGQVLGTPAYMSPEQARGEAHQSDRRSDIYSLGVILFELFTGELPFRGSSRMLVYQVLHEEPAAPRKLNHSVPRDLETICLKCLEKEPSKRYATARELALDLGRYVRGEPIHARPIGPLARSWRWSKRNKLVAVLVGGVIATLALGVAVSTGLYLQSRRAAAALAAQQQQTLEQQQRALEASRRAQKNAQDAGELIKFMAELFFSADPIGLAGTGLPVPMDRGRRDLLVQLLAEGEAGLSRITVPALNAQLRNLYGNLYRSLGDYARAGELLSQAREIVTTESEIDPRLRAEVLHNLGWYEQDVGRYDRAEKLYREALSLRTQIGDELAMATTKFHLAWTIAAQFRSKETDAIAEADQLMQEVLKTRRELLGPDDHLVALTVIARAPLLFSSGRHFEGIQAVSEAAMLSSRAETPPLLSAVSSLLRAQFYRRGPPLLRSASRARSNYEKALSEAERVLGDHPLTAVLLGDFAGFLREIGETNRAEKMIKRALDIGRKSMASGHPLMLRGLIDYGKHLTALGRQSEANELFREAVQRGTPHLGPDHAYVQEARALLEEP